VRARSSTPTHPQGATLGRGTDPHRGQTTTPDRPNRAPNLTSRQPSPDHSSNQLLPTTAARHRSSLDDTEWRYRTWAQAGAQTCVRESHAAGTRENPLICFAGVPAGAEARDGDC